MHLNLISSSSLHLVSCHELSRGLSVGVNPLLIAAIQMSRFSDPKPVQNVLQLVRNCVTVACSPRPSRASFPKLKRMPCYGKE